MSALAVYRRDPKRRKHAHRCPVCQRVIADGDSVLWEKVQGSLKTAGPCSAMPGQPYMSNPHWVVKHADCVLRVHA